MCAASQVRQLEALEDLARASTLLPDSYIFAALRPSERSIECLEKNHLIMLACLPCLWPLLLPCAPCIAGQRRNIKAALQHTLYVVTERALHIIIEPHASPFPLCDSKLQGKEILYEYITNVIVGNVEGVCNLIECPAVLLTIATSHDCREPQIAENLLDNSLLVEEPDKIAALILQCRDARIAARHAHREVAGATSSRRLSFVLAKPFSGIECH
jgi:hypothetical protein